MRNKIIEYLRRELIGPDPVAPYIQDNGEEILKEPPRLRYGAGVLFPQRGEAFLMDSTSEEEDRIIEEQNLLLEETDENVAEESKETGDADDSTDEEVRLANSFMPSAMGFSCFAQIPGKGFIIKVSAGTYYAGTFTDTNKNGKTWQRQSYFRKQLDAEIHIATSDVPKPRKSRDFKATWPDGLESGLRVNLWNRTRDDDNEVQLLTFTLINENTTIGSIRNEECFFQVSFSVESADRTFCFKPYRTFSSSADKEDEKSNRLLFRHKKAFAVGHGCSPEWDDKAVEGVSIIRSEVIPIYEIKPIVPVNLEENGITLSMFNLSDLGPANYTDSLARLNRAYESWIEDKDSEAAGLEDIEQKDTAQRHLSACRLCLDRMRDGVNLLRNEPRVSRAFRLMNRAMLLQQLRYSIGTRNWETDKKGNITALTHEVIPDVMDPTTWKPGLGKWRPFQIAFILMNLRSMCNPDHPDREMVDLIWFPTGGGKTEAYLGLSAYSIFLKRLNNPADSGTTVLMRYTLRLLTAQQFQRAAALICACETIRREIPADLGSDRITIGLWVGDGLTPNKRSDAVRYFKNLTKKGSENPFIVLKCPWCGAQMGKIEHAKADSVKGYRLIRNPATVVFQCDNPDCDYSHDDSRLPLLVIDEDIYDSPPDLLIGTVDKFAMLTWTPEARTIFGFRNRGKRKSPPELIIQDELHLISGPLGSMVGLYETIIEEFCTHEAQKPKIIASTATVSRAKEQINALYGRGRENVNIFPSQGLIAGDSFFAREDHDSPGRKYAGIFASALTSHTTAQVRVLSALIQAGKSVPGTEQERNYYWTSLVYFNSLRELGHAATLIRADIREYLNALWSGKNITGTDRRFIDRDIELTSRIENTQIPEYLEMLGRNYPASAANLKPVDICLASSMISVGVDISRLGLMAVIGQPKTTAEYIQATSRVGRDRNGPGLVFTIYNCAKPRDRSHFERFQEYHSKIYSKVEPTSVTPFSTPARQRALHALLIAWLRIMYEKHMESPTTFPEDSVLDRIKAIIKRRIEHIDPEEVENAELWLEQKLRQWKRYLPEIYGSFSPGEKTVLMYPAGTNPPEDISGRAWATPTSMRNVDATCEAGVPNDYLNIDNK